MKYDVIIIGAGPSGIFCAYELLKENVGQSGEISGKTSRSNALADGHES